MPHLTRRRDRDARQESWLIHYGDVHVGRASACAPAIRPRATHGNDAAASIPGQVNPTRRRRTSSQSCFVPCGQHATSARFLPKNVGNRTIHPLSCGYHPQAGGYWADELFKLERRKFVVALGKCPTASVGGPRASRFLPSASHH